MGFITLFGICWPFAPIFSFLTNLLNLRFQLKLLTNYGRRDVAKGCSGIGNWSFITGFVTYIAVPVNLAILLYARRPRDHEVGFSNDLDSIPIDE